MRSREVHPLGPSWILKRNSLSLSWLQRKLRVQEPALIPRMFPAVFGKEGLREDKNESESEGKRRDLADSDITSEDARTRLSPNNNNVSVEDETISSSPENGKLEVRPAMEFVFHSLQGKKSFYKDKEEIKQRESYHSSDHTQNSEQSPKSTNPYPRDKRNLKSLVVDLNVFEKLDLFATKVTAVTLEQLVKELTRGANTDLEKIRALWIWICHHIEYDTAGLKNKDLVSSAPEDVFRTKKGVCTGYSSLFEHMCRLVGVACQSVSGYSKGASFKPGQAVSGDLDHTWNMVSLEGHWHLLDCTWGAGYVDENISKFIFQYNEFYFLTHPSLFIGDHYPEKTDFQLLEPKLSQKQFEQSVHRRSHFYSLGLISSQPETAIIETEQGKASVTIESQNNLLFLFSLQDTEDPGLLRVMDHEAKFDIYPQKTVQQILHIYAKKQDTKEAYQMVLDYRIDCKDVDNKIKIPKCLSNPVGPSWLSQKIGLCSPSHKDPVIYANNGCCTIRFSMEKTLKLTASLKSDEGKNIFHHIIQTVQNHKVDFSIHLPQSGHYVLQIFDSVVGYVCNYLIICLNPKVKCLPFPALLCNPVGPNPDTEKAGLLQPSHMEPIIRTEDGSCTISFKLNKYLKLSSSLKSDKMQTILHHVIQRAEKHKVEFNIRLPHFGSYVFQIFDSNNEYICNYLLHCSNPPVKWPPFPSLLHSPVGPSPETEMVGLFQPSHPDPIVHTEDGCFTLSFSTNRILNLTVGLKSEDRQMARNAMHVIQSIKSHKLEFSVRLPGPGSYVLQIFDASSGYICNYLVSCSNPKVKWPPFPSSLHNPVGPNPDTEKAGLTQPSHPDPIIDSEDGCFTVSFALMTDLSIFPTLHSDEIQMTPEMTRRHVFQTVTEGNVQIKVHLPQSGKYVLHVNVKPKNSNMYKHQCNYLIICKNSTVNWPPFPLAYTDWAEQFDLVKPLEGVLPQNINVSFKLRIPDVTEVSVKGKDFFPLSLGKGGYWEGSCSTEDCRYMYVTTSSEDEPKTRKFVLQYQVGEKSIQSGWNKTASFR
ncbi:kyphoscoliosis peptidase-like isoform X2 [Bufo bufo]|uniref:kyphoscoliosis peptidase-like isoform X2 n=1 Tax=Bufo bufo TaxID=8384 RepID=UPI001ABE3655|nr:kyphoscoliosis peptidase-like isoform X2 [Bufo bufo]